jgi:hypothetical protein
MLQIVASLTYDSIVINEGKSAAIFYHQVAAWVPDMFCNFYLVKSHKIADNSETIKARDKISKNLESVEF